MFIIGKGINVCVFKPWASLSTCRMPLLQTLQESNERQEVPKLVIFYRSGNTRSFSLTETIDVQIKGLALHTEDTCTHNIDRKQLWRLELAINCVSFALSLSTMTRKITTTWRYKTFC